jgi:aldehyde:ferredoxin oxidoreductase
MKGITTGLRVEPKEVQQAIKTYYHIAGYNDNGIPYPEKLCSLGLEWLIEAAKQ